MNVEAEQATQSAFDVTRSEHFKKFRELEKRWMEVTHLSMKLYYLMQQEKMLGLQAVLAENGIELGEPFGDFVV